MGRTEHWYQQVSPGEFQHVLPTRELVAASAETHMLATGTTIDQREQWNGRARLTCATFAVGCIYCSAAAAAAAVAADKQCTTDDRQCWRIVGYYLALNACNDGGLMETRPSGTASVYSLMRDFDCVHGVAQPLTALKLGGGIPLANKK